MGGSLGFGSEVVGCWGGRGCWREAGDRDGPATGLKRDGVGGDVAGRSRLGGGMLSRCDRGNDVGVVGPIGRGGGRADVYVCPTGGGILSRCDRRNDVGVVGPGGGEKIFGNGWAGVRLEGGQRVWRLGRPDRSAADFPHGRCVILCGIRKGGLCGPALSLGGEGGERGAEGSIQRAVFRGQYSEGSIQRAEDRRGGWRSERAGELGLEVGGVSGGGWHPSRGAVYSRAVLPGWSSLRSSTPR